MLFGDTVGTVTEWFPLVSKKPEARGVSTQVRCEHGTTPPQRWAWVAGQNGELTDQKIFGSGAVVEAKQDVASIVLALRRDAGRLPHNGLCAADLPGCSFAGRCDGGIKDDILAASGGGSGGGGQCGRRRDEGEGREESGEELHCGGVYVVRIKSINKLNVVEGNVNEEEGWVG